MIGYLDQYTPRRERRQTAQTIENQRKFVLYLRSIYPKAASYAEIKKNTGLGKHQINRLKQQLTARGILEPTRAYARFSIRIDPDYMERVL